MPRLPIQLMCISSSSRSSSPYTTLRAASQFRSSPAPPRLPEKDQKLFEQLQSLSTGAFSTPKPTVIVNEVLNSSTAEISSTNSRPRPQINQSPQSIEGKDAIDARVKATGNGQELHPDVRRGAKPEFEGNRNPKTGEIGGPKNEPLRWGGGVDWSYNGRVTDF